MPPRADRPGEEPVAADVFSVRTIIFGVERTLYSKRTGLDELRRKAVVSFITNWLQIPKWAGPDELLATYVERYHAELIALQMAEALGEFPDGPWLSPRDYNVSSETLFRRSWLNGEVHQAFVSYLEQKVNFTVLPPAPASLRDFLSDCGASGATLLAFSNSPRGYVHRLLEQLDLLNLFERGRPPKQVYAIEDVHPHAKPERAAFDALLRSTGSLALESIMVDGHLENLRTAKALGMRTLLVLEPHPQGTPDAAVGFDAAMFDAAERALMEVDPAVDLAVSGIEGIIEALPRLIASEDGINGGINCRRRELEDGRRRVEGGRIEQGDRQGAPAGRRLQGRCAIAPPDERAQGVREAWAMWLVQWEDHVDRWWGALPPEAVGRVQGCASFLAGVLTSRFESWRRTLQSTLGGAASAPPPPLAMSRDDCARVLERIGDENPLPSFPAAPHELRIYPQLIPNVLPRYWPRQVHGNLRSGHPQPTARDPSAFSEMAQVGMRSTRAAGREVSAEASLVPVVAGLGLGIGAAFACLGVALLRHRSRRRHIAPLSRGGSREERRQRRAVRQIASGSSSQLEL